MRKSVIFCVLVIFCRIAYGQEDRQIMGKEEMEEFAEVINDLVLADRYEEAVKLYEANKDYVNPKKLSNGDRGWWRETAKELDEKLTIYNRSKERIQQAETSYNAFEYRKSWDLVKDMACDSTNTYKEYIETLRVVRDSLKSKQGIIEELDANFQDYVARFRQKRYDGLFVLLKREHLLGYVAEENVGIMGEILDTLNAQINKDPIGLVMSGRLKDRELIKSVCENDVSKLLYIMKTDVIHYYNMLFDTEAQIDRYRKSDEYQKKLAELEKIKSEAMKRIYCQEEDVEMGEYDKENGCFHVLIGSNKGVNLTYFNYASAAPQKAIGKRFEKVVHEGLEVNSVTDSTEAKAYTNGDKFVRHYMIVRMGEEMARKYENRRCRILICFVPAGAKEYIFTATEFYKAKNMYDVFQVKETFPYSTKCRVILFGEDD
ncbi:MAG: hypothetical protein MJ002_03520 [Paludibacteraceae bacterium]|nr:hypothetical protein [Paludibacteraceae bacterium]